MQKAIELLQEAKAFCGSDSNVYDVGFIHSRIDQALALLKQKPETGDNQAKALIAQVAKKQIEQKFGSVAKAITEVCSDEQKPEASEFTKQAREKAVSTGYWPSKQEMADLIVEACDRLDDQAKKQYDKGFLEGSEAQESANREHIIGPLEAELEKRKGAPGVLQQIADKLKSLTGKQNVWEAINQLEAANKTKDGEIESLKELLKTTRCQLAYERGIKNDRRRTRK